MIRDHSLPPIRTPAMRLALHSRITRALRRLHAAQRGATSLEWTLLLAAIAFPSYLIVRSALNLLLAHYRMMTFVNSLPFP